MNILFIIFRILLLGIMAMSGWISFQTEEPVSSAHITFATSCMVFCLTYSILLK